MRLNKISYEIGLLSQALVDPTDPKGRRLNPNGTLQKLVTTSELHDNLNVTLAAAREVFVKAGNVIRNLNTFSREGSPATPRRHRSSGVLSEQH